jgi:hypothetical protein
MVIAVVRPLCPIRIYASAKAGASNGLLSPTAALLLPKSSSVQSFHRDLAGAVLIPDEVCGGHSRDRPQDEAGQHPRQ